MHTKDIDLEQLLNTESIGLYKDVNEDLFEMELSLKNRMNSTNLTQDEFKKCDALLQAVYSAREAIEKLQA